jgi:hypothetical protein
MVKEQRALVAVWGWKVLDARTLKQWRESPKLRRLRFAGEVWPRARARRALLARERI